MPAAVSNLPLDSWEVSRRFCCASAGVLQFRIAQLFTAKIGTWTCLTKGSEIAFWEGSVTESAQSWDRSQDFFSEKGRSETDFLGKGHLRLLSQEFGAQVQVPENAVNCVAVWDCCDCSFRSGHLSEVKANILTVRDMGALYRRWGSAVALSSRTS